MTEGWKKEWQNCNWSRYGLKWEAKGKFLFFIFPRNPQPTMPPTWRRLHTQNINFHVRKLSVSFDFSSAKFSFPLTLFILLSVLISLNSIRCWRFTQLFASLVHKTNDTKRKQRKSLKDSQVNFWWGSRAKRSKLISIYIRRFQVIDAIREQHQQILGREGSCVGETKETLKPAYQISLAFTLAFTVQRKTEKSWILIFFSPWKEKSSLHDCKESICIATFAWMRNQISQPW